MNKRYLVMKGNKVENITVFNPELPGESGWIEDPGGVEKGWEQQADGSFAPPAAKPLPVEVTALNFRRALNRLGLRDQFDTQAAKEDKDTQDLWNFSTSIPSDAPHIRTIAQSLGISRADLDNVYRLAAG